MLFVTAQDFNLVPLCIPNMDQKAETFELFVEREELKVLEEILGSLLADEFVTQLESFQDYSSTTDYAIDAEVVEGKDTWKSLQTPNLAQPLVEGVYWTKLPQNIWLLLKYGTTYAMNEKSYKWKGMNRIFVPYLYAMWTRADAEGTDSGIGVTIPKAENADVVSPALKISRAYNEFSELVGNRCNLRNTLYGYLYNSDTTFYSVVEDEYTNIQQYLADRFVDPGEMNVFNL